MFFEGDSPCKGRVLVKSFDEAKANPRPVKLIADNKTEANDICRATQCGYADSFEIQNGTFVNVTCSGMCVTKISHCFYLVYDCNFQQTSYLAKCDLNN